MSAGRLPGIFVCGRRAARCGRHAGDRLACVGHLGAQLAMGLVAGAVILLGLVGLAIMVKRRVQRRWMLVQVRLWEFLGPRFSLAARNGGRWSSGQPLWDARWWASQWTRHRLWTAVTSAEQSVSGAEEAGAPVGDLPVLCRRLRVAAQDLDRLMRVAPGRGEGHEAARSAHDQVAQVVSAARSIQETAAAGMSEFGAPSVRDLADDVQREVHALRAGLRHSREALKL